MSVSWAYLKTLMDAYIRRVPRVYRIDWYDARVRISAHSNSLEDLKKRIDEMGGEITNIIYARKPLVIVEADLTEAAPPGVRMRMEEIEELRKEIDKLKKRVTRLARGMRPPEEIVLEKCGWKIVRTGDPWRPYAVYDPDGRFIQWILKPKDWEYRLEVLCERKKSKK